MFLSDLVRELDLQIPKLRKSVQTPLYLIYGRNSVLLDRQNSATNDFTDSSNFPDLASNVSILSSILKVMLTLNNPADRSNDRIHEIKRMKLYIIQCVRCIDLAILVTSHRSSLYLLLPRQLNC